MYLINSFTTLVDLSGNFTDVAGVTHRISQLLEKLNALEDYWKENYPDDHYKCPSREVLEQWTEKRNTIRENLHTFNFKSSQGHARDNSGTKECNKLLIWSLENVTLNPPKVDKPLISNLNLEFFVGESVIITGNSSAGAKRMYRL